MDVQSMLSRMTFKDFLTTQEGRKVARQLVTNLIEQQIGHEHGVSCHASDRERAIADQTDRHAERNAATRVWNLQSARRCGRVQGQLTVPLNQTKY